MSDKARLKTTHPLYWVWKDMIKRCKNPRSPSYKNYGRRGIKICDRWDSFWLFVEDMGPRPSGTSIDRINNDGDYEPSNCRWATSIMQIMNSRTPIRVAHKGKIMCLAEWAREFGIHPSALSHRIKNHGIKKAMQMGHKSRRAP